MTVGRWPEVATLVCFHAHPDDESIATGGVMAKASAEGHRVVLVVATGGELGEPVPGVLRPGELLGDRRVEETHASARVLGVQRVEFLGYRDSGMAGEPSNEDPACFWQADVDEAAQRLADLLGEEAVDALTVYDDNGNYGHPDHIQVHRVGVRAAALLGIDAVFEATMNRDAINRQIAAERARLERGEVDHHEALPPEMLEEVTFGKPEAEITHAVDVSAYAEVKRASMRCHASQIAPDDFFLAMPDDRFAQAFGTEWFIRRGAHRGPSEPFGSSLFG